MRDRFSEVVIIIPAYNPDEKLLNLLADLEKEGFKNIILINDGSKKTCDHIFEIAEKRISLLNPENTVLKHWVNLGQGRAFKTGFNYFLGHYKFAKGGIQCDADGQHCIEDICKCAELLLEHKSEFILGVRNFNVKGIPFRSRFGNKCACFIFWFFLGIKIKDTQTGLKGIPRKVIEYLVEIPGERFDYATSVLLEIKRRNIPIRQFDIKTIYINGNESSHFNPIHDSIRIYSLLFKYASPYFFAYLVNLLCFWFLVHWYKNCGIGQYIFLSNYSAQIVSVIYVLLFNRLSQKGRIKRKFLGCVLFGVMFVLQATVSSALISHLYFTMMGNFILLKVIVDFIIYMSMCFIWSNGWWTHKD